MSMDTPRTLKDALTEALQAALHCLRHKGLETTLQAQLGNVLGELYRTHHTLDPERALEIQKLVSGCRITLDGVEGGEGATVSLDEALKALSEYLTPERASPKAPSLSEAMSKLSEGRIGAPGASKDKASYSGAKFDVSPESFARGVRGHHADSIVIDEALSFTEGAEASPPTRQEIADKIIDELEAAVVTEYSDGYKLSRLSSLRQLITEVEGERAALQEDAARRKANLEQVLTYAHRRLSAYPEPDGVVHLQFMLRLAAGLTTLQSPPTGAEVGAALYEATELAHRKEGVENSLEEERTPDAMLALGLALIDELQRAFQGEIIGEEEVAGRFAGLRNLIKDLAGGVAAIVEDGLDHIPGSILEELEADIEAVDSPEQGTDTATWKEDNLERVRILRGCFAAYNTKAPEAVQEDKQLPETEGRLGDGAEAYPLSLFNTLEHNIETGQPGGDEGEAWRLDSLEAVRILKDRFLRDGLSAEAEHEHNVMCLPYHSALREVERRINIYRDDTLEAYNDFGETVVSKSTITAVNTFTAQVIKIITDVAGDSKGYNRGTVEREAAADKGYPRKQRVVEEEGRDYLADALDFLAMVCPLLEMVAGHKESLPPERLAQEASVLLRAIRPFTEGLDKPLPGTGALYAALVTLREYIDGAGGSTGQYKAEAAFETVAQTLERVRQYCIAREADYEGRRGTMISVVAFFSYLEDIIALVTGDSSRAIATDRVNVARQRIEEQDGAPDVRKMIDDKLRESMYVHSTREDRIYPPTLTNILELVDRIFMATGNYHNNPELLGDFAALRNYVKDRAEDYRQAQRWAREQEERLEQTVAYLLRAIHKRQAKGKDRMSYALSLATGRTKLVNPPLEHELAAALGDMQEGQKPEITVEDLPGDAWTTEAIEETRREASYRLSALNKVFKDLLPDDEEDVKDLEAARQAFEWLRAYFESPEGAPIGTVPPALYKRIRERAERAITEHTRAPFASGAKNKLYEALREVSAALKDAGEGKPRQIRYEITEGVNMLLTVSGIEAIDTLYGALWSCEAERNISHSLSLLHKLRTILLDVDKRAGEANLEVVKRARLAEELEVAEDEAHRAQSELRDINARQVLANQIHAKRDEEQRTTIAALREDNELLSGELELYQQSLIAYLFSINRLKHLAKANIDLSRAVGKAVGQLKTGQILRERPEWVKMDRAERAEKLLEEIVAITDSARTMGEEELELQGRMLPLVEHKIREGLTEG